MKYPYIVIKDGVWYPAGTDVPVGETRVSSEIRSEEPDKPKRGRKPKES